MSAPSPEDISERGLRKLWEKTLGPEASLDDSAVGATYRPRCLLPVKKEHPKPKSPFEPTELIGRGGVGEVFRARQPSLEREVALKKLRASHSSDLHREAFLAEAVVTGQLEHPNIVPVYAMGTSPDGEVYLAMKLVGGTSWRELLRKAPDDLVRHLEILLQVCNAVAFAHSRDIIHNDLKPTNVMVGEFGEVTVLDWGNAVSTVAGSGSVRHRSSITTPCGTPSYMAPELALGEGTKIGPWTDVYLLGAVLYEILGGSPPHRADTLLATVKLAAASDPDPLPDSVPEDLRAICAKALQRAPADRHAGVQELAEALRAFLRHRESRTIAGRARDRLEAARDAVGAAGREHRNRLYQEFAGAAAGFESARELWPDNPLALRGKREVHREYAAAALRWGDLGLAEAQAELAEAPELLADIRTTRARRRRAKDQRRRLQWGLAGAVGLLVIGLVVGLLLLRGKNAEIATKSREVEAEKLRVEEQRGHAERRGEIAQQALDQITNQVQTLLTHELADSRGFRIGQDVLRIALEGWRELRDSDLDRGEVSRGTALTRLRLARLLLEVEGDAAAAHAEIADAVDDLREAWAEEGTDRLRGVLAMGILFLGDVHRVQGDLERSRERFAEALDLLREEAAAAGPEERESALRKVAICLVRTGNIDEMLGQLTRARGQYREAIELYRDEIPEAREDLASALDNLGDVLRVSGQPEAVEVWQEALAIRRAQIADDPEHPYAQRLLSFSLLNVGDALSSRGELDRAEALFDEALALRRGLLALSPGSARAQRELTVALERVGNTAMTRRDFARAREIYDEALVLDSARVARDSTDFHAAMDLAISRSKLGDLSMETGALDDAHAFYAASLDDLRRLLRRYPDSISVHKFLMQVLEIRGDVFMLQGAPETAGRYFADAAEVAREAVLVDASNAEMRLAHASVQLRIGDLMLSRGALDSAAVAFGEAHTVARELHSDDPEHRGVRHVLYLTLIRQGDLAKARSDLPRARVRYEEALGLGEGLLEEIASVGALQNQAALAMKLGLLCRELGEPRAALDVLLDAVGLRRLVRERLPEDEEAWVRLCIALHRCALACMDAEDYSGAVRFFSESLAETRQLAARDSAWDTEVAMLEQELAEARSLASVGDMLSGRREPQTGDDWLNLARAHRAQARHGLASAAYAEAFARGQAPGLDYLAAARSAALDGDPGQALAWLTRYVELARGDRARLKHVTDPRAQADLARLEAFVLTLREDDDFVELWALEPFQALFREWE